MDDVQHATDTGDCNDEELTIAALDEQNAAQYPYLQRWLLNLHLSRKRRTLSLRLSLAIAVVLLVALVISGSFPVLRMMTGNIVAHFEPSAAPLPIPFENKFFVDTNIAGTQVSIDGRRISYLSLLSKGEPLTIAPGHHLIVWSASPFGRQSCTLSVPGANGDTCSLADFDLPLQKSALPAQVLMLQETLNQLPKALRLSLSSAIQSAVTNIHASTPVQPGEKYIGPSGDVIAQQSLIASLHYTLAPPLTSTPFGHSQTVDGEYCPQICIVPAQSSSAAAPTTANQWIALVLVQSYWEYATTDGRVLASHMPIDLGQAGGNAYPILARITHSHTGWRVQLLIGVSQDPPLSVYGGLPHDLLSALDLTQIPDDPACVAAQDLFPIGNIPPYRVRYISSPNIALGCFVAAPVLTHAPVAYFFEHLGIFYAVNTAAHDMERNLPQADAYEQSLVQHMLAFPRYTTQFAPSS